MQVLQSSSLDGSLSETRMHNLSTIRESESFWALIATINGELVDLNGTANAALGLSLDLGHPSFWYGNSVGDSSFIPDFDVRDLQLELPSSITRLADDRTTQPLQRRFNITAAAIATMQSYLKDNMTLLAIGQALEQPSDFAVSFATAARTISNRMRIMSGAANATAGTTQVWALHLVVRWRCLAYPGAVLLVAVLFVGGTVVHLDGDKGAAGGRGKAVPVAKSSVTVALLRGFDDHTREFLLVTYGEQVERSRDRGVRVQLDKVKGRLVLQEQYGETWVSKHHPPPPPVQCVR